MASKKLSARSESEDPLLTPNTEDPVETASDTGTTEVPGETPSEPKSLAGPDKLHQALVAAQEALEELKDASGIGTIAQWEFTRSRAHRPNARVATLALQLIEEAIGPYVPVDPEVAAERATPAGVRYNGI